MNPSRTEIWWLQRLQTLFAELGMDTQSRQATRGVRVRRLDLQPGQINARLLDRELGEGSLNLLLDTLSERQWSLLLQQMSNQAFFAAQLLSEQIPPELEVIFRDAGASLLPQSADELHIQSTFPEDAHARLLPALYSALVDLLLNDPWLLLLLRGRHRDAILQELRQSRNDGTVVVARPSDVLRQADGSYFYQLSHTPEINEESPPLAAQIEQFWGDSRQLRSLHHHISAPTVELALLRRLGPIGQSTEWQSLQDELSAIYRNVTEAALALAFEVRADPEQNGSA